MKLKNLIVDPVANQRVIKITLQVADIFSVYIYIHIRKYENNEVIIVKVIELKAIILR